MGALDWSPNQRPWMTLNDHDRPTTTTLDCTNYASFGKPTYYIYVWFCGP